MSCLIALAGASSVLRADSLLLAWGEVQCVTVRHAVNRLLGFVDALQVTGEVHAVLSFTLARNGCWVLSSAFSTVVGMI